MHDCNTSAILLHRIEEKRQLDQAIVVGEQEMQVCKRELVQAFEQWYAAKYEKFSNTNVTSRSPLAASMQMAQTRDSKEQYDMLEAQRFQGDDEAYTFYQARKNAKLRTYGLLSCEDNLNCNDNVVE